jgi:hypothetical protein
MIKDYFSKALHHWKVLLKDRAFVWSLIIGFLMIGGAIVAGSIVSVYLDANTYVSVGDAILDNIPTYDLTYLFYWGPLILITMMVLYGMLFEPEAVPFALKTYGLLIIIRCGFIVLTHIGPPFGYFFTYGFNYNGDFWSNIVFKNDLFFSAHTAIPFLAFLLFRKSNLFRGLMLVGSIVMGITVLLMHVHYSIDVFGAFFITYGIYAFSNEIFNKLNLRFKQKLELYGWEAIKQRIKINKPKI